MIGIGESKKVADLERHALCILVAASLPIQLRQQHPAFQPAVDLPAFAGHRLGPCPSGLLQQPDCAGRIPEATAAQSDVLDNVIAWPHRIGLDAFEQREAFGVPSLPHPQLAKPVDQGIG